MPRVDTCQHQALAGVSNPAASPTMPAVAGAVWGSAKVQAPDRGSACPSTFVDAGIKDACGNKSMRNGSRAWHSQMDAGATLLLSISGACMDKSAGTCLRQQKHENRQQGMSLAGASRGHTLAQHVPALLSMQAPEMPAATKA